jgi:hypothetical protein
MVRYRVRCWRPARITEHTILPDGSVVTEVIDPAPARSCATEDLDLKGVGLDVWEDASVEQQTFMFADSSCRLFCDRVPLWVSADRREGHFAVPVFSLEQNGADLVAPKFAFLAVRYVKFQDRRLPVSWCTNLGCPDSHDRLHLGSSLESLDYDYSTAEQFMGRIKPLCACGELLLEVESLAGGGLGEQVLLQGFQNSTLVSLKHVLGLHAMQAVSTSFSALQPPTTSALVSAGQ